MINTANIPRAYSEVYAFMNAIEEEYINKIPSRIYENIKNNRDKNYNPVYDKNQTMTDKMISREALALIAGLNLQYWCNDEGEKNRLKQIYKENQAKENEKYNYENLFKKEEKTNEIVENEQTALVAYQERNVLVKLVCKFKEWMKKREKHHGK